MLACCTLPLSAEPENVAEAPKPAVPCPQAIFLDDDVEGEDPEVSAMLADRKESSPSVDVTEAQVEEEGEGEKLLMAEDGEGEEGVEEMEEGMVPDTPTWDDQWDNLDLHPKVKKKFKSLKKTV